MNVLTKEIKNAFPDGVCPVMLTAFDENGSLDLKGEDCLTDYYLHAGARFLFACALSSEVDCLDDREKIALTEHILRRVDGRVPVIAGALSASSLAEQVDLIKAMVGVGADGVAVSVCQIAHENEDDQVWLKNMDWILQQLPDNIRLGLYECPWPYRRLLSDDMFRWVAESGRFYFLKDTCGQIETIRKRLEVCQNSSLMLFNANTETLLLSLQAGASGFSGIGANYYPELYVWLCDNYKQRPELSLGLQGFMDKCYEVTEGQYYPISAKEYLRQQGMCISSYCRTKQMEIPSDVCERLSGLHDDVNNWIQRIS